VREVPIAQEVPAVRQPEPVRVESEPSRSRGNSWLIASSLFLVGFFGVCSLILVALLWNRSAERAVGMELEPAVEEKGVSNEDLPAVENSGDGSAVNKASKNAPGQASTPPPPADAVSESVPHVFSKLSVGNEFGYSISISAEVPKERQKISVDRGRNRTSERRPANRTRGGGALTREQDTKEQVTPEVVRWEGLASYTVSKNSKGHAADSLPLDSANTNRIPGLGIPGRYVLVSRFEMKGKPNVRVHVNGRSYKATKAPSGTQRTFMVLKVAGLPTDFGRLPASLSKELQPYTRFKKSVWNSVSKSHDGLVKRNRAVAVRGRSNSHGAGAVCWRDTGKIGGICFNDQFVSASKIQNYLPEEIGPVFDFEFDPKRRPDFSDSQQFENQIIDNLVSVTFESERQEPARKLRPSEQLQINQDFWMGQFLEEPCGHDERSGLRGPFVFESSSFLHPGILNFVDGKMEGKKGGPTLSASMPLLLPRVDEVVFQDFATVTKDETQDALFVNSGIVRLLEDGESDNMPMETQYRVGKYRSKLTSIEKGPQSTKVFRSIKFATPTTQEAPKESRSGRRGGSRKGAGRGGTSGLPEASYTFPIRIDRDEVIEFDNRTGSVRSVEIKGTLSQGEGAKRQATVPYTATIERVPGGSSILVASTGTETDTSGERKKLQLTVEARTRIVKLLKSQRLESRTEGLEMLNLYEPRKERLVEVALSQTLDSGYWGSDLIYKLTCDWLFDPRIQDLLKDADQRNDFRERRLEQETILFLAEKFPKRILIDSTYESIFRGLLRAGDESVQQETVRVVSENFPRMFEGVMLQSEMFQNANRKPPLYIIELLGHLGTSKTVDHLSLRVEKVEAKKKQRRSLQRNEGDRLAAYQTAIEQIEKRTGGRRK
jgi:hypothetical protein